MGWDLPAAGRYGSGVPRRTVYPGARTLCAAPRMPDQRDSGTGTAFGPDKCFLVCAESRIVEIWDVQSGRRVK
jgi:hypothetical protein